MTNTPDFCRSQAQAHMSRAEAALLPNVRTVALAAAATWTREAELADMLLGRRARLELRDNESVA